jgi:aspartokinase-like uncharacterized kinase
MIKRPVVIKVGGSLLQQKSLLSDLALFLDGIGTHQVVLLTGGGPAVKAMYAMRDKLPHSESEAHWECIKLMGDLTRTLCERFPNSVAVTSWSQAEAAWQADRLPWFVVEPFLREDEASKDHLPHSWDVSSDSIAAHLSKRHDADLILLKACKLPTKKAKATEYAQAGIVDPYFSLAVKRLKHWKISNLPGGPLEAIVFAPDRPKRAVKKKRMQRRARR